MYSFSKKLLEWYALNKRKLHWRDEKSAYKIWLSEIILQQTRIEQGTAYYLKFVKHYPDIYALAKADEEEILFLWQGLGYYSRARNLHKTAQIIVGKYQGNFPSGYKELIDLPGIGDYTASAILSFAFNKPFPTVDGNVLRFVSRFYGVHEAVNTTKGSKIINKFTLDNLPPESPANYNQALMDFGSVYCKPQKPDCRNCIFNADCFAYENQMVENLPFKKKQAKSKRRFLNYFLLLFQKNDALYTIIRKRNFDGIWKNLYDFPLIENSEAPNDNKLMKAFLIENGLEDTADIYFTASYKHVLSHQVLHINFSAIIIEKENFEFNCDNCIEIQLIEIDKYPFPIVFFNFLQEKGMKNLLKNQKH